MMFRNVKHEDAFNSWYQLDFSRILGYTKYFSNIYKRNFDIFNSCNQHVYVIHFNKKTNSFDMCRRNCLKDIIYQIRIRRLYNLDK
jgi:hypothetical protein